MEQQLFQPLEGKVALVTGSSKGIGRGIALRFAQLGASVVVNYIVEQELAEEAVQTIEAENGRAIAIRADVSVLPEIEGLFEQALSAFSKLDIVVANAGVEKVNIPVTDVTEEDFDRLFRINTKGPYFVMQAAARHVQDGGRIINISSSSTSHPHPGLGLYGTSKSAPNYLVRVLAQELGSRKITVNSLVPGAIDGAGIFTGLKDDDPYKASLLAATPLGRLATPGDVADVAAFLASEQSFFITGEDVLMNGGASN